MPAGRLHLSRVDLLDGIGSTESSFNTWERGKGVELSVKNHFEKLKSQNLHKQIKDILVLHG